MYFAVSDMLGYILPLPVLCLGRGMLQPGTWGQARGSFSSAWWGEKREPAACGVSSGRALLGGFTAVFAGLGTRASLQHKASCLPGEHRGSDFAHQEPAEEEEKCLGSSSPRSPRGAPALSLPAGGCAAGSRCSEEVARLRALTESDTFLPDTRTAAKRKRKSPTQYANGLLQLDENICPGTPPRRRPRLLPQTGSFLQEKHLRVLQHLRKPPPEAGGSLLAPSSRTPVRAHPPIASHGKRFI